MSTKEDKNQNFCDKISVCLTIWMLSSLTNLLPIEW